MDTRTILLIRNPLRVVVWVVDDLGALVRDTSGIQCDGSNNNEDGSLGASNCAVSSWENPLVADDDTPAEVEVGGSSERRLVRELSKCGRLTSDDSSSTEDFGNGCATRTLRTFFSKTLQEYYVMPRRQLPEQQESKLNETFWLKSVAPISNLYSRVLSSLEPGCIHR